MQPRQNLEPADARLWNSVLAAGVKAQQLVPGAIAVGGSAAALYAAHRLSIDTDHLVAGLKEHFDETLAKLDADPEWRTARTQRPVLILGSINNVEVGFREPRRRTKIETCVVATSSGGLVVPTLLELIGIKAFMAYFRNAARDYLDFAALSTCSTAPEVLRTLLRLDESYSGLQKSSVRLEVAKALAAPAPYDLESLDLARYKALATDWQDWRRVEEICRRFGKMLGEQLLNEGHGPQG